MSDKKKSAGSENAQTRAVGWTLSRRDFLKASGAVVVAFSAGTPFVHAGKTAGTAKLSFGVATDAHYADVANRGVRYYSESLTKMTECVALMNDKKVDFLIELGDFKDQDNPATEKSTLKNLETIEAIFGQFKGRRYHVLGNHDVDSISKEQFLDHVENTEIAKSATYYSFDAKGLHFIVLDANYMADGSDYDHGKFDWTDTNIPRKELDWLENDLASTSTPAIIFLHQQLDSTDSQGIKNAATVRQVLQESGKVLAVFQGHNHAGHYSHIEDIHYYTLKAMVVGSGDENNSYAIVEVFDDHSIVVTGYRRALDKKLEKA